MRKQYDFENMKGEKNPYSVRLKKPVTIRIDTGTISYFKNMASELGVPYQNLINLFLRDCALNSSLTGFLENYALKSKIGSNSITEF